MSAQPKRGQARGEAGGEPRISSVLSDRFRLRMSAGAANCTRNSYEGLPACSPAALDLADVASPPDILMDEGDRDLQQNTCC